MSDIRCSTLYFNKKAAALTTQKIVIFLLSLFVLFFFITPVTQEVMSTFNVFGEDKLEESCQVEGYERFSKDTIIYCEKDRESEVLRLVNPSEFKYFCSEEYDSNSEDEMRDQQQIERYERIAQEIENEENCVREGDEECSCVMNAFLYQQNQSQAILNGDEIGDSSSSADILKGSSYQVQKEFRQKQNSLLNEEGNSYYDYDKRDGTIGTQLPFSQEGIEENEILLNHLEIKYVSEEKARAFIEKTNQIADELNTDPRYLISIMAFETGDEFGSCVQNPQSSATGLIQFLEATARNLDTSTEELCQMNEIEQLEYVKQYFQNCSNCRNNLDEIEKLYTAVFYGSARNDLGSILYRKGSSEYRVNAGLDTRLGNDDGAISVREVAYPVRERYYRYFEQSETS